ncbi:hypothetical protein HDU79_003589 [Rhizoclosmatium sp. JEL0117]|nr:hypothetical protein HDU79_003589 [Rhizoclosmatium sp. JEL0117]
MQSARIGCGVHPDLHCGASLVLVIPLVIAFQSMNSANNLSVNTGRNVANSLALKIQTIEGSLTLNNLNNLINQVNSDTKSVFTSLSAYVNKTNMWSTFQNFAYTMKYKGALNMYYGTTDNRFVYVHGTGKLAIWITVPANYVPDPACGSFCQFSANYTPEQWKWVAIRDSNSVYGDWNQDTWVADGWQFANFSFKCSGRPWFKKAAAQNPNSPTVLYTDPYLFAGGDVGETGGAAGITATIPFFDGNGTLQGVYGTDIGFTDMHAMLVSFLQTPNAFMYVMTRTGSLIGVSSNESIIDASGNLKFANASSTTNIQYTATYLQSLLPPGMNDYTLLDTNGPSNFDKNGLYFQMKIMQQEPRYVIINGAPKSDYTGNIDSVLQQLEDTLANDVKQIIGIAVGVFVAMVFVSCVLTYFTVTIPLAMITKIMIQATSFDFSAFKQMEAKNANIITELGTMEEVFYKMIEKFAASIKANRELSGAPPTTGSARNTTGTDVRKTNQL